MAAEAWEREFWGAVLTVLEMQDESLESWLGAEDSKAPAKIIEQAEEALEWAVKDRIARCKEDFEQRYQDRNKRSQVLEKSKEFQFWNWPEYRQLAGDGVDKHDCPACSATGMLSGTLWNEEVSDDVDPDDPTSEWVDQTYVVEEFLCPTCTLHLFGTNEARAGELPEEFTKSEVRERDFGPEYGND